MEEMNKTADYKQGYRDALRDAADKLLAQGLAIENLLYSDEAMWIVKQSGAQGFGQLAEKRYTLARKAGQYYTIATKINDMRESI